MGVVKSTLKGVNRESTIELCDRSHDRRLRVFGSHFQCSEAGTDRPAAPCPSEHVAESLVSTTPSFICVFREIV